MDKRFFIICVGLLIAAVSLPAQPQQGPRQPQAQQLMGPFIENFSHETSDFLNIGYRRNGYDFRYHPGVPSLSEEGTDVIVLRINPSDPATPGPGPHLGSKLPTFYGSYSARLRVPDVKKTQPDIGVVVGYFTYTENPRHGLSEIDWEWLIADPQIIYIGAWTGHLGSLQRVGRIVNMATGEVLATNYRVDDPARRSERGDFDGEQNIPVSVTPIEGYDASKRFYVYGFDWYPERIVWWMVNPDTNEKIVLWDYKGRVVFPNGPSSMGVPTTPTRYNLNFWHTNNWAVETNPNALEPPKYPYALEVDWMSYKPFDDLNKEYLQKLAE